MSNIDNYVNYFRSLAINCVAIGHDPASETGDALPAARKFARWNAEEVISGLRTEVGWPCLLIELYETDFDAANVYDIKKRPKGAFTVLQHAQPGSFNDEQAAFSLTEEIVYDLVKKIWQDHYGTSADRCNSPFRQFYFDGSNMAPVGPLFDGAKFGYRVEFGFELQHDVNITEPPAPGKFINP